MNNYTEYMTMVFFRVYKDGRTEFVNGFTKPRYGQTKNSVKQTERNKKIELPSIKKNVIKEI